MKERGLWISLGLACFVASVLLIAQAGRSALSAQVSRSPSVALEGREIPVPVTLQPAGPLFGLAPLAEALGAELSSDESGESVTLRIGETDVVMGLGSAIVTVGDAIVSLSQPPVPGEGGVQVPIELLRKSFGDLLGYNFEWRPEVARLIISRRGQREMRVTVDVVHLQGVTTVVLQFSETPRYKIHRQPGTLDVQLVADRVTPPLPPKVIKDPLVQNVAVEAQMIRVSLAEEAEVDSYVLENPFRLVFDVHRTSSVVTAPARPLAPRPEGWFGVRTIVIDPGHGGKETGAIGPSGVQEKELTLELARELKGRLEQRLPVRVVLTRDSDVEVAHDLRTAIANQNQADLFISIHLNSSLGAGAHGAETYFLSTEASDARAALAAATENLGVDETAQGDSASQDLQLILWDLAQTHHLAESQRLANLIQGELNETLQLKDRGVKQAPFRVLMGATMPAVLVEVGFVSNLEEEKKLQDAAYRLELVEALTRAVGRYKAVAENREQPQGDALPSAPGTPGGPRGAVSPP